MGSPGRRDLGGGKWAPIFSLDGASSTAPSSSSSSFGHGMNSDVDATAEQLTTTSITAAHGVLVKAHRNNTGIVYVGNSDVTAETAAATDGLPLEAGETLFVEVNNPNKLYVIASAANQKVHWFAV